MLKVVHLGCGITLGKIFSSGIMPSYPFFILSILASNEASKPLEQEITSQGYCYQALIYLYLRKQEVENNEIDIYINFLSEIAFYLFSKKLVYLTEIEYINFIEEYEKKYNLPLDVNLLLDNLNTTRMLTKDTCGNYYFYYPYLYYYFVAKYLAEHLNDNKKSIDHMIRNLHNDENAYITVFIAHHTKNDYVLDEIVLNSLCLFDNFKPATLLKNELNFFDEKIDEIINAVLPSVNVSPEAERTRILLSQDEIEESNIQRRKKHQENVSREDEANDLLKELRRSVKTVEVMGQIVKNRSGSLLKDRLEEIIREGIFVHLRILSSFFEIIKDKEKQSDVISFLIARINSFIEEINKEQKRIPDEEKLRKIAEKLFWRLNFSVIYGFMNKIIHSLGSDKLQNIINKVCDDNKSPATILIKHGVLMWYSKQLQIHIIADEINAEDFSETGKEIMKYLVVKHCSLHSISHKNRNMIEKTLKIPAKKILETGFSESK